MFFADRREAGQKLAQQLEKYQVQKNTMVIALPRGGVVIGYEIAKHLNLPLEIVISKKIPFPDNPEFAIGAVTLDGQMILDEELIRIRRITKEYLAQQTEKILKASQAKLELWHKQHDISNLTSQTVILTDDGMATGMTMKAAIGYVRRHGAAKICVALPVAPPETVTELSLLVDEIICLYQPSFLSAIGAFYRDFTQVSDEEVAKYLKSITNAK